MWEFWKDAPQPSLGVRGSNQTFSSRGEGARRANEGREATRSTTPHTDPSQPWRYRPTEFTLCYKVRDPGAVSPRIERLDPRESRQF